MSATCRLVLALCAIVLVPSAARAQSSWEGTNAAGGSALFETPGEWNPDGVPGNGDGTVTFDSAADNGTDTNCDMGASHQIDTLTIQNAWAATLNIQGGFTLTMDTGPFTLNSASAVLDIDGAFTITGGNFTFSAGTIVNSGTIQLGTSGDASIANGTTFTNSGGSWTWSDGSDTTFDDDRAIKTDLGNVTLNKAGDGDRLDVNDPIIVSNLTLIHGEFDGNTNEITVLGDLTMNAADASDVVVVDAVGDGDEFVFTGTSDWSSNQDVTFADVRVNSGAIVTLQSSVRADVVTVQAGGILILNGFTLTRNTLNNSGIVATGSLHRWTAGVAGDWATAGNWTPAGPPGAGDVAVFDRPASSIHCTVTGAESAGFLVMETGNTDNVLFSGNSTLALTDQAQLFGGTVSLSGSTGQLSCATLQLDGGTLVIGDGQASGSESNVSVRVTSSLVATTGTLTPDPTAAPVGAIQLDATSNAVAITDTAGGTTYNFGRIIHTGANNLDLMTPITVQSYLGSTNGQLDHDPDGAGSGAAANTLTITGDPAGNGLEFRHTDHVLNNQAAGATPAYAFTGATGNMSWIATGTGGEQQFHSVQISGSNTITLGSNVLIDSTVTITGGSPKLAGTGRSILGNSDNDSITVSAGTLTVAGTITVGADTDFNVNTGAALVVDGSALLDGVAGASLTLSYNDTDVFTVAGTADVTVQNAAVMTVGDDINWTGTAGSGSTLTIDSTSRFVFCDDWTAFAGAMANGGTIETGVTAANGTDGTYDILTGNAAADFGRVIHASTATAGLRLTSSIRFTSYEQNVAQALSFNGNTLTISGGGTSGGFVINLGTLTFGGAGTDLDFVGTSVWDDNNANAYDDVRVASTGSVSLRKQLTHGGVAGAFVVGETVTGTAGATGVLSEVTGTKLEVITIGGTALFQIGDTVTGATSGATCVLSAVPATTLLATDLTVNGTLTLNGTRLDMTGGALTIATTGTIHTRNDGEVEVSTGASLAMTGSATINASGSAGTLGGLLDIDVGIANTVAGTWTLGAGDATLGVAAGTVDLTGLTITSTTGSVVTLEALTFNFTTDNANDFTGLNVVSTAVVTYSGTLDVAGLLDVDGQLLANGDTVNAGSVDIAAATGTLNVTGGTITVTGLLDVNGTFTGSNATINANGDVQETGATAMTLTGSTLNFAGTTQTLTTDGMTAATVNVGASTSVTLSGSGTFNAGAVNVTAGSLIANINTSFDGGAGVGLTVGNGTTFVSNTTNDLTHAFAGTGSSVILNGTAQFTVVDPVNDANDTVVTIENGTAFTMNGNSVLTLTGTATENLDFRSVLATNQFTMAVATTATVNATNVNVTDSNASGSAQTPLVAGGTSAAPSNSPGWVVGVLWIGGVDQNWGTNGNWLGGFAPTSGQVAVFTAASNVEDPPTALGSIDQLAGLLILTGFEGGTNGTAPIQLDEDLIITSNFTYTPSSAGVGGAAGPKLIMTGGILDLTTTASASIDRTIGNGTGTLRFRGTTHTVTPGANSATINLALVVGGTGAADTATTVNLAGTNALTVASTLTITDATAGAPLATLTTTAGPTATLTLNGNVSCANDATLTAGGTAIVFNGASWTSGGNATHSGTFLFSRNGAQGFTSVAGVGGDSFGAMTVNNGAGASAVTFNSAVSATSLNITAGDTLSSASDITLAGSLTSAGGLTHSGGAVIFTASGVITSAGDTLNALTIQNGAVVTTGDNLSVTGNVIIQGSDTSRLNMDPGDDALSCGGLVITRGVMTFDGSVTGGGSIGALGISFGPAPNVRSLALAGAISLAGTIDTTPDDASVFSHAGTLTLTNALIIERSATVNTFATLVVDTGGGTVSLGGAAGTLNASSVTVTSGVLDMNVSTSFGAVSVANGATLQNDNTDTLTHTFTSTVSLADGASFIVGNGTAAGAESCILTFQSSTVIGVGVTTGATFRVRGNGSNFHTMQASSAGAGNQFDFDANGVLTNVQLERVTIRDGDATLSVAAVPVANGFNATPTTNVNFTFGAKTTTWVGVAGNWSTVSNWDNGPPNDGSGDTVQFAAVGGTSSQDIVGQGGDGLTLAVLNMSTGPYTGSLTLSQRVTVSGAATLNGTVALGANPWSSASLTINGNVTAPSGANAVSTGSFTINNGGDWNEGTANTTITGNLTVGATGTWVNNTGTLIFAATGTPGAQDWSGSGDGASGVGEVSINNGNGGVGQGVVVTLTGSATVSALTIDDNDELQITAGLTLFTTAAGTVTVGDAVDGGTARLTVLAGGGVTNALNVANLVLNRDAIYTETSQNTRVTGDLTIATDASWADGAGTLTFDSNAGQAWNTSSGIGVAGVGAVSVTGGGGTLTINAPVTVTTMSIAASDAVNATDVVFRSGVSTPLTVNNPGTYTSTGVTEFAATVGFIVETSNATYAGLTLSGAGADTLEGAETITGVLTVDTGSLATGAVAFQAAGITGTGTLNATGGAITTTAGLDVANFTAGASLTFNGTGNWGGTATTFGAVTLQSGTITATADLVVASLTSTAGALTMGAFDLTSAGTIDLVGITYTQNAAASTVLTSGAAQSLTSDGDTVGILDLQGGTDLTLTGALVTGGAVLLSNGSNLTVPSATGIDIGGALTIPNGSLVDVDASSTFRGGVTVNGALTANAGPITLNFGNGTTLSVPSGGSLTIDDAAAAQITIQGVTSGGAQWNLNYVTGTVSHGAVTGGPFQVGERIVVTGGSGAEALITAVNAGSVSVGHSSATFLNGETIVGQTSGASAVVTVFTLPNITIRDLFVRDSAAQHPTIPGGVSNINLGNNTNWFDLSDLDAFWDGSANDDWDDPDNWVGSALPTNGSNIVIQAGAPRAPQADFSNLPGPVTNLGGITIPDGFAPGSTSEVVIFDAPVNIGGTVSIGAGSTVESTATTFTATTVIGTGTLDMDSVTTSVTINNSLAVTTYLAPAGAIPLRITGTLTGTSNFGTVTLIGPLTAGSDLAMTSLDLGGSTFTLGAGNDLDVGTGGITDTAAGTLNATGAHVETAGGLDVTTYTPGTDLEFDGTGTWAGASNFGVVLVSAGTVTLGSGVTATNLTVGGGTLDTSAVSNFPLTANNLVVSTGSLLGNTSIIQPLVTLNTTGAGTVTMNAGALLLFAGNTAAVTCDAGDSLGTLRLTGAADVSLAGTVGVGSVQVQAGELDGGSAVLQVNTTWSVSAGATFTSGTSRVEFVTASGHSIAGGAQFFDLRLAGGTMAPPTTLTVLNDLSATGGTWNEALNGTLNVRNNFDFNGGTYVRNGGAVVFNGTGTQDVRASGAFNILRVDNAATTLQQLNTVTVSGQLQVQAGVLNQNSQTMIFNGIGVLTPISVTAGASINGSLGTMQINVDNDGFGSSVTLANPGSPGYHNVTLDSGGASAHTYTSATTFTCTGALAIDLNNRFLVGAANTTVTVGSLTGGGSGNGVFDMNFFSNTVLELTASGTPLGLFPTNPNPTTGFVRYNSTGAAATVNTTQSYVNLELAGSGKNYGWGVTTLTVTTNLTLTGGASFSTAPGPMALSFTSSNSGNFRGNASSYTLGTVTVNKPGAQITLLGTAGGTRTINNLDHDFGVFEASCNLRIVDAVIGFAAGDADGGDAAFVFDTPNTTLTLGQATGNHNFDVRDTCTIGGGSSDVTLSISGDGTAANLSRFRIADDAARIQLNGNASGSGTTPNLTIRATNTGLTAFQPQITETGTGTTIARQGNPLAFFIVANVDVQDNDCTGIVFGNEDGTGGEYTGAGIQAQGSSQLNANTPGWIFVGGGSITARLAEAIANDAGNIDVIRVFFSGSDNLDQSTLGTVHQRFALVQTNAFGTVVQTIQGTAASIDLDSHVLEVEFGTGVAQTHVTGLSVLYDAPSSGFLRTEGGTPASIDFTLTTTGSPKLYDGARPVLLSSAFHDSDGNGGHDRGTFVFSEPMTMSAGGGWAASGFKPATTTTALGTNVELTLVICGETLSPIQLDFNGNQFTGEAIAAEIQNAVRAVMAESPPGVSITSPGGHDPLNRPAFMNFTCTYLDTEERYVLNAGVPLRWDVVNGRYVQDYTLSTVGVVVGGANDASVGLKLGAANGGSSAAGYGDAMAALSIGGLIADVTAMNGDTLTMSLNGEPSRDFVVGGSSLDAVAQSIETSVRAEVSDLTVNQTAYSDFVVVPDDSNVSGVGTRLIFVVGGQGAATQVEVDSSTNFAQAALMGAGTGEQTDVQAFDDVAGSLGGTYFTIDAPGAGYYVWIDVDNGSADPVPLGRTAIEVDIRMNDTAVTIAAAIAAAVDALADFEAQVTAASTDTVQIINVTPGNVTDAADGIAPGDTGFVLAVVDGFTYLNASEAVGDDNATTSIEDLLITSPLGQNLLLGMTSSTVVISGSVVTVDLANQAGSGTGTPRFIAGDRNANGGFFADASGLTNMASAFGNVPALDGIVVQGDTDGDATVEVDPDTNIRVDASNIVIPGGTLGASVAYQWALVSTPGVEETTVVSTVGDAGGTLNSTFFLFSSTSTDYYVWFNVGGTGTDPNVANRTGIMVALTAFDPASTVADAIATALDPLSDVVAAVDNTINTDVVISSAISGNVIDAADGTAGTGFSFAITDGNGSVTINSDTTAILDFGATFAGNYEWALTITVFDANGVAVAVPGYTDANGQVTATVFVDVQEIAPVADAGDDQVVIGTDATLDGSQSFDPNGGVSSFTYLWSALDQNGNAVPAGSFTGGSGGTPQTSVDPVFTPGQSGVYTVTLTVAKVSDPTLTDSRSIQVLINDPSDFLPVAHAGDPHVGRVGTVVTLRGRASADPEGTALTFQWSTVTAPEAVSLSDAGDDEPTFIPNLPGSYVFQLTVADAGGLRSAPHTVTVQVADDLGADVRRPPGAAARAAGLEQAVFLGSAPANLDTSFFVLANGSSVATRIVDVESDTTDDPASGSTTGMTRVQLFAGGTLEATLYATLDVSDFGLASLRFQDGSTADVHRFGRVGEAFVLDASQSQDDGVVTSFLWEQTGGPYRFDTMSGNLISVIPQTAGTYVFELVVTDNLGLKSLPMKLSVPVLPTLATDAGPPTAIATGGSGTTAVGTVLTASPGTVSLDASESSSLATGLPVSGGAALTYSWTQVSGPTAVFADSTVESPSVDLPTEGAYAFELTVTDANDVSATTVVWVSANTPVGDAPVAIVEPVATQSLPHDGEVVVTVNASRSEGALPLTFVWGQEGGVPFAVEASASTGTFRIDQPGTYTLLVRVIGADGVVSPPTEVTVHVDGGAEPALASGGVSTKSSGGCALMTPSVERSPSVAGLLLALVAGVLCVRRRVRA